MRLFLLIALLVLTSAVTTSADAACPIILDEADFSAIANPHLFLFFFVLKGVGYSAAAILIMLSYWFYRRLKPSAPKHHLRFGLMLAALSAWAVYTINFSYAVIPIVGCSSHADTGSIKFTPLTIAVWCLQSLIIYGIYSYIMRLNERSRKKTTIIVAAVLFMWAIALPVTFVSLM